MTTQIDTSEPLCRCKDRPASQCPCEWEHGCDLGNNPKHVKVSTTKIDPSELTIDTSEVVLPPIDHDSEMDRDYIPLPGGWELQTKGKGSTLRLVDTKTGERHPLPLPDFIITSLERMSREIHAAVLADRAARPAAAVPEGWQPIATAPKDGTHILACHAGRPYDDTYTFNQAPPSVVHWFGWPEDVAGFYLSVSLGEQKLPFEYTHWKPLGNEPCDTKRLEAEAARYTRAEAQLVCDYCGANRLKQPCGEPHRPDGCRFTGTPTHTSPFTTPTQAAAPATEPQAAEAMRKDAKRYRLLRRGQHWSVIDGFGEVLRGEQLDAAIDKQERA